VEREKMKGMKLIALVLSLCFVFGLAATGLAEDFPKRPIRVIIPYSAGGGTDVLARAFQKPFEKVLGVKALIDCIPAGATKVGTMEGMKAKPDGYTLIMMPMEAWVNYFYSKAYDTKIWEKLTAVGNLTSEPMGFIEVRADSPYKTWADLVKAAKENPGKLTCAGGGAGGATELIFNAITKAAGIQARFVPFAGAGPTKTALLGGHVDFRSCQPTEAITMIQAGKTRGLAVSTDQRMEALPDVPTFKELGIGESILMHRGYWGPPNMPPNIVNILATAIEKAGKDAEFTNVAENQFLYKVTFLSGNRMKELTSRFDEKYGPELAASAK
jgi:tripartite-type tricarboxylate transporter receptor subunit TctC